MHTTTPAPAPKLDQEFQNFADAYNCAIIHRGDSIALLLRHYTNEGIEITRQQPDSGDFYTVEDWQMALFTGEAQEFIA
jgi:hypothetical protein